MRLQHLIERRSGGELIFHGTLYNRLTSSGKSLREGEQRDWFSFVRSLERITPPAPV